MPKIEDKNANAPLNNFFWRVKLCNLAGVCRRFGRKKRKEENKNKCRFLTAVTMKN
jgi:hypothetical protein